MRIIHFLTSRYAVPMSVVELRAFRTPAGELLLAREETGDGGDVALDGGARGTTPIDERWARVRATAEAFGFGEALAEFTRHVRDAGLFARPYTRSVMITPPTHRNRYLAVVSFTGPKAHISFGPDHFAEFYTGLAPEQVLRRLGSREDSVDADGLVGFGKRIAQLFEDWTASTEVPDDTGPRSS